MAEWLRPTTTLRLTPFKSLSSDDTAEIAGPMCRELFDYWTEKKGVAAVPAWSSFEFMDLYRLAPLMTVLDVPASNDPNKVRYRFMGTKIVEYRRQRQNPDLTGFTFEEGDRLYDPQPMLDAMRSCIEKQTPALMMGEYETMDAMGAHARLMLPWEIDGRVQRLTMLLERLPKPKP